MPAHALAPPPHIAAAEARSKPPENGQVALWATLPGGTDEDQPRDEPQPVPPPLSTALWLGPLLALILGILLVAAGWSDGAISHSVLAAMGLVGIAAAICLAAWVEKILRRCSAPSACEARGTAGHSTSVAAPSFAFEPARAEPFDRVAELDRDGLTGLGRDASLHRAGQAALAKARLAGRRLALVLVDLDRFSDINALHGCHVGDGVLRGVARQLVGKAGDCCVAARLNGDRFALMCPDLTDEIAAARWAEGVLDGLGEPFDVEGMALQLSASAGIAVFPDHGLTVEAMLRSAEMALSEVKRAGGGRPRVFCKRMDASLKARKALERELRQALDNGDFQLHYQPQIDLRTGRISGVEGLLRWPHRSQGMIPPAKFIPLAESCGLIRPLGAWVMAEACRAGRRWHDLGLPIEIAVNLSAAQLRHQELVPLVGRTLVESGLPARALELELTESLFVDPSELHLRRALERVAEMGVRLAIDDFGTGYSSLAYLKRLPFNKIKIDRSFLVDVGNERVDEAIVRAIIGLARTFGKLVLAEGVETEAQRHFLLREGCDAAQGYLFSRPVSEEAVTALLQADAAHHHALAGPIARAG